MFTCKIIQLINNNSRVNSVFHTNNFLKFLKKFYLFLDRGEGREKEKRNIFVWLPLMRPLLGTWLATQVRARTGNTNVTLWFAVPTLSPLSHTSQGCTNNFKPTFAPPFICLIMEVSVQPRFEKGRCYDMK